MHDLGSLNRRKFLAGALAGAAALAMPARLRAQPAAAPGRRKPDIIFLMTDQQRWDAIGALNPHIKTPHIDRLAQQGIIFRQTTCQAPMCVPSRNSMMFGLYPSQIGIRSNGSHSNNDETMPHPPIAGQLKAAGYQTAGFGKTHWGRTDKPISTRGFEVRAVGAREVGEETGSIYQDDLDPQGLADYRREVEDFGPGEEEVPGFIGATSTVPARDHRDGWVAEQCLKFLDSGVDPDRPLFLYLSFLKPHAGLNVPKEFEDLYDLETIPDTPQPPWANEPETHLAYCDSTNKFLGPRYQRWREAWEKMTPMDRRRTTLRYYANCSWLDDYFGKTLDKLQALGRLDNALIVFTSDHGEMLSERNYRFTKYCLYDSSVRVPLVLAGSAIPAGRQGTIDDRPAELVDLFPTLLKAAGAKLPVAVPPGLDLLGERKHVGSFCEFHDAGAPAYMWRKPDWKLILFMATPLPDAQPQVDQARGELYDLKNDPHEWNNLYDDPQHAAVREQMKTELLMNLACVWAGYPMGRG